MPTARSDAEPARPVMRPLEYAVSSQIIDAHTRQLVAPRTVVAEYNSLLDIVQRVAILGGEFRRGYRADAPRMTWLVAGVFFRVAGCYADPEMGEPTDRPHYAITLCERIELEGDK